MNNPLDYLGKTLSIQIDRPLGSKHPKWDFIYEVNYGFVPDTLSGDGEELDAYILGINEPLEHFTGTCIAILQRKHEDDDKLIITPDGLDFSDETIKKLIHFQEQFFESEIIR